MFDNLVIGQKLTEHYTHFDAVTLVEKKPVPNWPFILGIKAATFINENLRQQNDAKKLKILLVYGGAGRTALEILRNCSDVDIEFTDKTANNLQLLEALLKDSSINWFQKLEGEITEPKSFHLESNEHGSKLLEERNNTILFWQSDYKNIKPSLKDYDLIVADFRHKNAGSELLQISQRLKVNGSLVLGSIDNVSLEIFDEHHSLNVLKENFLSMDKITEYPHMYMETRNKHQYAISYLSIWKKISSSAKNVQPSLIRENEILTTAQYYEDQRILTSYEEFHFGEGSHLFLCLKLHLRYFLIYVLFHFFLF